MNVSTGAPKKFNCVFRNVIMKCGLLPIPSHCMIRPIILDSMCLLSIFFSIFSQIWGTHHFVDMFLHPIIHG